MKNMTTMKIRLLVSVLAMAASSAAVAAPNCTINLKGDDAMKYDLKEVTVSASCPSITVQLQHTGKLAATVMGHNVVVSKTADLAGLAKDAIKAGAANAYVPAGDARVIAHTSLIGGGASTKASFAGKKLTAGEDYSFFCSFPGHSTLMKGKIIVTK